MKKRVLPLLLAMVMLFTVLAACGPTDDTPAPTTAPPTGGDTPDAPPPPPPPPDTGDDGIVQIPRNETLWFNGFQWGVSNGWNPFSNAMNNPLAMQEDSDGARLVMFETPYMYNMLDGKMYPLLADGDYSWNADRSELSYTIKDAATWNDGTPVTAHDAAFTWYVAVNYGMDGNSTWNPIIADIVAQDDKTVVIKAVMVEFEDEMVPANANMMVQFVGQNYILQKAWLEDLIDRNGGDQTAMNEDRGDDVAFSGPYGPFHMDDIQTVLIRNEDYWGQDASMWGKLPAPRFIGNVNYETNAAGDAAIVDGNIDVSQQFIMNVHLLWEDRGLPISTYFPNPPYHIPANMPTGFFNLNSPAPGITDPVVRKAIAMATDYDLINANAMTGQSPSFRDYPRSLMNTTAAERALLDNDRVAHLQWVGNQIDEANEMLDEAGYARNPDNGGPDGGWRELDGAILEMTVSAPDGWSDWQAAMEVVAAAGAAIGIKLETWYPAWGGPYEAMMTSADDTELDIFMVWTSGISPVQPWDRIRGLISSEFTGSDHNWSGNWGQYVNPRVDEILEMIPLISDQARLRDLYTELVEIYLTDVPSFSLMYRPDKFHTVYEGVWTGFTEAGDGRNVPPVNASVGYAIADLYNIRLVG
ncbi:MAG: ABC transporter substrate-binding protein [Oscillospiraceae bacterium]|nr:ABC transporter substrate-binding protein [Oscillospiraceae bacterium]